MSREKSSLCALLTGQKACVQGATQWKRLLAIADYSKASSLLYRRLKGSDAAYLPAQPLWDGLRHSYELNRIRNLLVVEELNRLADAFYEQGITAVPLKGAYLLHTTYRSESGVRRLEDVDLLIAKRDLSAAHRCLRGLGYLSPDAEQDDRPARMYFKYAYDGTCLMPLHVHTHIVNMSMRILQAQWKRIDVEELLGCALLLEGAHPALRFLQRDDALLTLCEHAFRHGFSRVMLLYDIHLVITQSTLDWQRLIEKAKKWGMTTPLFLALRLSQGMFSTIIPCAVPSVLRPRGATVFERLYMRYVLEADCPSENACVFLYLDHAVREGTGSFLSKAACPRFRSSVACAE